MLDVGKKTGFASSGVSSKSATSFFAASLDGGIRIALADDADGSVPDKEDMR